jgi:excinuclease ABC subunit B
VYERDYVTVDVDTPGEETFETPAARARRIAELEAQMKEAARRLDFEQAAELRDRVKSLRRQEVI